MPRLSRAVIAEREAFVTIHFKAGMTIEEAQRVLFTKDGHKMNPYRLKELFDAVQEPPRSVSAVSAVSAVSSSSIEENSVKSLENEVEHLKKVALDALRERDDAKSALKQEGLEDWRTQIAKAAFPQASSSSVSWEDIVSWFGQEREVQERTRKVASDTLSRHCLDSEPTVEAAIDSLDNEIRRIENEAESTKEEAIETAHSESRTEAEELLTELGYDVGMLMDAIPLDDSQNIYILKGQK